MTDQTDTKEQTKEPQESAAAYARRMLAGIEEEEAKVNRHVTNAQEVLQHKVAESTEAGRHEAAALYTIALGLVGLQQIQAKTLLHLQAVAITDAAITATRFERRRDPLDDMVDRLFSNAARNRKGD